MQYKGTWKPGYAATAVAVTVSLLVLIFSYRPAVRWFDALEKSKASSTPSAPSTALPVTGVKPVPEGPGFPWWALVVVVTIFCMTLFLWRAGYTNVLAASSRATANAAERRARSYTFDALIFQRLNENKGAQRLRGAAGRFARAALALKGTSQVLDRIESAGAQLDLPPVGTDNLSPDSVDAEQYEGMPPRLDSLTED